MLSKLSPAFRPPYFSGRSSVSAAAKMALSTSSTDTAVQREEEVLVEKTKHSRTILLNRPRQLNAISYWMTGHLKNIYEAWEEERDVQVVLVKGSGRAFSAGGDVAEVYRFGKQGWHEKSMHFFSQEYNVNYLIGTYKKPHVALIDGIVMGGGAGLSINGSFKVVTEKTVFAMPETGLGLHPDVGASYFLSRLPGHLGEYIGLTGARLDGAELLAVGLATHYVPSERLAHLEEKLKYLGSANLGTIDEVISNFSKNPQYGEESILCRLDDVDQCFSKSTVEEIFAALEQQKERGKWYLTTLETLRKASPTSLKITLKSIRDGRNQTFYECLRREYRMTVRCLLGEWSNDFYEGCRAILIEKDRNPKWDPATLAAVTPAMVDHYFVPFQKPLEELQLPGAHRQQTAVKMVHPRL
ncbi:hypothetical protein GOP47_0028926 [Adiantum capillus-veneris]|nr:hypothetical protein GOP47_0028926 [Adiantum capillus-veneris]